uniref:Synaptopodin-2-like n=1 Tax=Hippocampus comes TaxID=109280 RepID=A0A3Q2Y482_HIPCM
MSCTSLGSAHGMEGEQHTITSGTQEAPPSSDRKPLSHHGVVQGKEPAASASPGRGILSGGVGGPGASTGSRDVGGGPCELPGSFSVAFQIPSDEGTPGEEQDTDSDQEKPNKHRARHARFRRSESLSEKQVKEAKSKCKRIALLLSAAQPNPNNKGLLMFKKHRQRAKKYTLVSYGTGEDKRDDSTEEEDDDSTQGGVHVLEFTLADQDRSDLETHFLTNARSGKGVLTICLDKSLLDVEQKQSPMECLPETKGKGALMFAQRRQRMDEIAAEHEELRRQGMPVEGAQKSYEQQQTYHQGQHGPVQHQSHEAQRSLGNRTAKPFLVQNMAATPYSPAMTGTNQGQGEQIASRDERIATPAIRSGLLDSKRRNVAKPMFTFKETPKMSPNPDLLNLLNMSSKKMGFESGPEEDYLSLGAEACNFLQSSRSKHKTPPPVAPKPVIDPSSAPWSPQMEVTNQDMPQHAENSAPTPAVAPTAVTTPLSDQEPTSNVTAPGSAYEMPAVRGKGADMFAKRQSRMEKYVVDSETVQAHMASRSTSPTASLPNEWKYTPNVRAPPSRGFNPIQSPSYPPAASKQPPSSGPMSKAKKKGKQGPAPKPLDVVDVMKHQPYQLSASLFTYGSAGEGAKEPAPKPSCSPQNQKPYEQMAPVQSPGSFSAPYPQQAYDGNYQPTSNAYTPSDPHQQSPGGVYWQPYNQQTPQLPSPQYPPQQVPYQGAGSPPYLSPTTIAFQQPLPASVAPSFPVVSPPGSTTSGNTGVAPKPKFTAKKSCAQVWKPTVAESE